MRINYKVGDTFRDGSNASDYTNGTTKVKVIESDSDNNSVTLEITQPVYIFPRKQIESNINNEQGQYLGLWSKFKSANPVLNSIDGDSDVDYICFDSALKKESTGNSGTKWSYIDNTYYEQIDYDKILKICRDGDISERSRYPIFEELFVSPLLTANAVDDKNTVGWYLAGLLNYNNVMTWDEQLPLDEQDLKYAHINYIVKSGADHPFGIFNQAIFSPYHSMYEDKLNPVVLGGYGFMLSAYTKDFLWNEWISKVFSNDTWGQNAHIYAASQFINYNQQMNGADHDACGLSVKSRDNQMNDSYALLRSITEKPIKLYDGINKNDFGEIKFRHRTLSPIYRDVLYYKNNGNAAVKESKYPNFYDLNSVLINDGRGLSDDEENECIDTYRSIIGKNQSRDGIATPFDQIVSLKDVRSLSDAELTYTNGKITSTKNLVDVKKETRYHKDTVDTSICYYHAYPQNDGLMCFKGPHRYRTSPSDGITTITTAADGYYYGPIGAFDLKKDHNVMSDIDKDTSLIPSASPYYENSGTLGATSIAEGTVNHKVFNRTRIPQYSYVKKKYNSPYCWYTSTVNLDNTSSVTNPLQQFAINGSDQFKNICQENDVIYPGSGNVFDNLFHQTSVLTGENILRAFENYSDASTTDNNSYRTLRISPSGGYNVDTHKIDPSRSNSPIEISEIKYIDNTISLDGSNIQVYSIPTDIVDTYSVYNEKIFDETFNLYEYTTSIWGFGYRDPDAFYKKFNHQGWRNAPDGYSNIVKRLLALNQSFDIYTCPCDSLNELRQNITSDFYTDDLSEFKSAIENNVLGSVAKNISTSVSNLSTDKSFKLPQSFYTADNTIANKLISKYQNTDPKLYPAKYCIPCVDVTKIKVGYNADKFVNDCVELKPLYNTSGDKNYSPIFWRYSFMCIPIKYKVKVTLSYKNPKYIKYVGDAAGDTIKVNVVSDVCSSGSLGVSPISNSDPDVHKISEINNCDLFKFLNDQSNKKHVFIVDDSGNDKNIYDNKTLDIIARKIKIKFLHNDKIRESSVTIDDYSIELPDNCYSVSVENNKIKIEYKHSDMCKWVNDTPGVGYLANKGAIIENPIAVVVLDSVTLKLDNTTSEGKSSAKTSIK